MYPKYRRFLHSIHHPKTVISLIASALFLLFLSQIIPQADSVPVDFLTALQMQYPACYWLIQLLKLDQIFTSPLFVAVIGLLCLSLIRTVYEQFTRQYRYRSREIRTAPNHLKFRLFKEKTSCLELSSLSSQLSRKIRSLGYRVRKTSMNNTIELIACHHGIGFWGSIIFHLGLLLLVGAALLGSLSYTSGFGQIPDGGTLFGKNPSWLKVSKGIMANDLTLDFNITMNGFYKDLWENQQTKQMTSYLIIHEPQGPSALHPVSISHPLQFRGLTIYQTWWQSYVVSFSKTDANGTILGTFFLDPPKRKERPHTATGYFPRSEYLFELKLPNPIAANQQQNNKNPLLLTISKNDTLQFLGAAHLQKAIVIDDIKITLLDIRPWSGIRVVRWYGQNILYSGFFFIVVGVFFMYVLRPREIHIYMEMIENRIHGTITSRTKYADGTMEGDLITIDRVISSP